MFDFETNQTVETLSGVDAAFHPFYQAAEGDDASGFVLRTDPITSAAVSALSGASTALKAARNEAKGFKGKAVDLASLGEYGDSVETIAAGIKAKVEGLEGQLANGADAKVNLDKLRGEMKTAGETARQGDKAVIQSLTADLHELLVTNTIRAAAGDDYELVAPFVEKSVKVVEVDGKRQAVIVDAAGDIRYNGVGAPMTIAEQIVTMKSNEKLARLFTSQAPKGGDTRQGTTGKRFQRVSGRGDGDDKRTANEKLADAVKKRTGGVQ